MYQLRNWSFAVAVGDTQVLHTKKFMERSKLHVKGKVVYGKRVAWLILHQ